MIRVCEKLLTPAENIPGRGGSANRSLGNGSSASIFQTIDFEKKSSNPFSKSRHQNRSFCGSDHFERSFFRGELSKTNYQLICAEFLIVHEFAGLRTKGRKVISDKLPILPQSTFVLPVHRPTRTCGSAGALHDRPFPESEICYSQRRRQPIHSFLVNFARARFITR